MYDIFFSYEKHDYSTSFTGCRASVIPMTHFAERNPLAIHIRESDNTGPVKIDFDYNYAFFDADTCMKVIACIRELVEQVVTNPLLIPADISILPAAERELVGWQFPLQANVFPVNNVLPALVLQRAILHPEQIAIVHGQRQLTYRQMNERILAVAAFLETTGIGRNDVVALLMDRSDDMLILMLGILYAGAAHLTIDPGFPAERIRYILADSGMKLVICKKEFAGLLGQSPAAIPVVYPEDIPAKMRNGRYDMAQTVLADDLAYVLYTSGSTGSPKGVEIPHRALANFLFSMQDLLDPGRRDRFMAVTTYSFDISLLELYLPLISGATVVIAGEEEQHDPFLLRELAERCKPTVMQATPSLWSLLIGAGWEGDPLLTILCGGEQLKAPLAEKLLSRCGTLWNMYGPTETTIWSMAKKIKKAAESKSIGRPIGNTEVFVLDKWGGLVPVGFEGEICIGGLGLAQGYRHKPALTRERFVPHFFNRYGNARLYRTGDKGRWLSNGEIAYIGRLDDQVKVRGYRIELSEIEQVISKCEAVSAVAVVVHGDDDYDRYLTAFVILRSPMTAQDLTRYCSRFLPAYMVPDRWMFMDHLPLTPNGKIDKKALAAVNSVSDVSTDGQAAGSDRLHIFKMLWRSVLHRTDFSAGDNFFECGGNSFKVLELTYRIEQELGLKASFSDIFRNPTLQQQATMDLLPACREQDPGQDVREYVPGTLLPATSFQRHIYEISRFPAGSLAYTLKDSFLLHGRVEQGRIAEIVSRLLETHEQLRTVFRYVDGNICFKIVDRMEYPFPLECYRARDKEEALKIVAQLKQQPVDIEGGPLWLLSFFTLDEETSLLFVRLHHLVCDGASLDTLIRDFFDIYRSLEEGKPWVPPELPLQFRDYAAWQNRYEHSAAYDLAAGYWSACFARKPEAVRFGEGSGLFRPSYRGKQIDGPLDALLWMRIQEFAQAGNVSPFVVLLAAFYWLLRLETGNTDLVICVPVTNRDNPGSRQPIGLFINTLAIRLDLPRVQSFSELTDKVKEVFLEAYEYRHFPFHRQIELVEGLHGMNPTGLFNVMLNYQPRAQRLNQRNQGDGLVLQKIIPGQEESKFDMAFNFYEYTRELLLEIEFRTAIFKEQEAMRMRERFMGLLEDLLRAPKAPLMQERTQQPADSPFLDIPFDF